MQELFVFQGTKGKKMDIGSKELPGEIIKWVAIIGGIILFHEVIFFGLFMSLDGLDLLVEYLEILIEYFTI